MVKLLPIQKRLIGNVLKYTSKDATQTDGVFYQYVIYPNKHNGYNIIQYIPTWSNPISKLYIGWHDLDVISRNKYWYSYSVEKVQKNEAQKIIKIIKLLSIK